LLYSITRQKNISVAVVFSRVPLNISFHRGLVGNYLDQWYIFVSRVVHIRLNNSDDMGFTLDWYLQSEVNVYNVKIKIFMRYIKPGEVTLLNFYGEPFY
jgi:hypothetical protein